MDYKDLILRELEVLRLKEIQDKQPFKVRAYAKVIAGIKGIPGPIHQYEDVAMLSGIGEKLQAKIKEIIETGKLASAEKVRKERNIEATNVLIDIYGVGPVKAGELLKMGITSIAELREAVQKDPLLLNENQVIGLKYYEDLKERIPRKEMEQHESKLLELIHQVDTRFKATVVGSYRRGAKDSGDIDVLLSFPITVSDKEQKIHFTEVVRKLISEGYLIERLAKGPKKFMGISRLDKKPARRVDLLLTPANEYAFAILYFTGSDKFNVAMRKWALTRGVSLNEHGFKVVGTDITPPPVLETEEAIFNYLGLRYVSPPDRTGSIDKYLLSA
jgi:DNA polymerase/3'-5' exonuclease PolX